MLSRILRMSICTMCWMSISMFSLSPEPTSWVVPYIEQQEKYSKRDSIQSTSRVCERGGFVFR